MRKGQGSVETLLIIAAVLVIAVAVVLTANYLLGGPKESTSVIDDKFAASLKGAELIGYDQPFDGTAKNAPESIIVNRKDNYGVKVVGRDELAGMDLTYLTSLNGENGTYPVYVSSGGGGGGGTAYITTTPDEADTDGDGITDGNEKLGCVTNPDPNCGVPTSFADLSVGSLTVAAPYDNSITYETIPTGATVELRATINNKGAENASGFTVKFYRETIMSTNPTSPQQALAALPVATISPPEGDFIGSVDVSGLEAGGSVVISVPFAATVEEDKDFVVVVDPDNKIPEENLDNNVLLQEYTVAEVLPDAYLATKDISVAADNAHEGDTVTISATISNKGGKVTDMPVEFFVKDYVPVGINPPHNPGTAYVTMPITALAAGSGPSIPPCETAGNDPVCGTDDKTYTNACYASQAGTPIAYNGECNDGWHYIGQDTIDVGAVSQEAAGMDWTSVEGNYTLIVWANPMGTIEESSTGNNQAESAPFEVQKPPVGINPPPDHNTLN